MKISTSSLPSDNKCQVPYFRKNAGAMYKEEFQIYIAKLSFLISSTCTLDALTLQKYDLIIGLCNGPKSVINYLLPLNPMA